MLKKCFIYSTLVLSLVLGITMAANESLQQVEITVDDCLSFIEEYNSKATSQVQTAATDSLYASSPCKETLKRH